MSIASRVIKKLNEAQRSSYSFTPRDKVLKKYPDGFSWVLSRDKKSVRKDVVNLERKYNDYTNVGYGVISSGTDVLVTLRNQRNVAVAGILFLHDDKEYKKYSIWEILGYSEYREYILDFINKNYTSRYFDFGRVHLLFGSDNQVAVDIKKNLPNIEVDGVSN